MPVVDARPRRERPFQVAQGLLRRLEPHRLVGGAHRPHQHPRAVTRLDEVVRDLGRGRDPVDAGLERGGAGRVQPGALAGQEVVEHRGAQQLVRERVAGALRHQHSLGHGHVQRLVEGLVVEARHPPQHPVGHGL